MTEHDAREAMNGTERVQPNAEAIRTAVNRLAKVDRADYLAGRVLEAERLGIPVGELDKLVKAAGGSEHRDEKTGRILKPRDVEPWHEEVDGAALLSELSYLLGEYVIMTAEAADAAALWAVHTHVLNACHYTPRLFITSPDKRCGKSQLLKVLNRTVARPLNAGSISAASFFRTIQAAHPTLLVDEFDAHKKDDEEMRAVVNNGYERDNPFVRCDPNTLEPLEFDTFAAVAVASIGKIWTTVVDRSITVQLQRKKPSETVRKIRRNSTPELDRLAQMAARWGADNIESIAIAQPSIPNKLSDRAADIWEPLIAIADIAGGDWPTRARHAACVLSGEGVIEDETIGAMLLSDLRDLTNARAEDGIATRDIIDHLTSLDERPWPAYGRARKAITAKQIADILKPYEVRSTTIRVGMDTPKGYRKSDLVRAYTRYLGSSAATTPQPAENREKSPNSAATFDGNVADENRLKPAESLDCGVVADENGQIPVGVGEDTLEGLDDDEFERFEI